MITRDELCSLYDQWKWTGRHRDLSDTQGKHPGLDRALRHLKPIGWASLASTLLNIRPLDQTRLDRKRAGEKAAELLKEAAELLRKAECEKIADLADDLAACAIHAGEGEVLAQPLNMRVEKPLTPDDWRANWRTMRLYPSIFPDTNVNMLSRAKPQGKARNDPEAAKNGAAVRLVAPYFEGLPDRDGVIADLLKEVGVIVPRQSVNTILKGYASSAKMDPAKKPLDFLALLSTPPKK